ncbi:MAG: DUF192 domain-containing protein [Actinomycetota bacterium]|nr:DUF192 domain-containing protein [Actinomycetota bacterium]
MRISIASSNVIVASELKWARSMFSKARGLIGTPVMSPGAALVIEQAKQVHTFGMTFPLDVVFCDPEWLVLHIVRSMAPGRMTRLVWRARFVIELPGGSLPSELQTGESLRLDP